MENEMKVTKVLKPMIQTIRGPFRKHSFEWVNASALLAACFLSVGLQWGGWAEKSAQSLSLNKDLPPPSEQ
jgi:hypothetical protein